MDYRYVETRRSGSAFFIRYHSDEDQNLLTLAGMQEILHAMEECRKDTDSRVLIFTGWEDVFCMGGFLGNYMKQGAEEILAFADILTGLHREMSRFPKPTIAAVNGHVGGGGLSFLEAFDLAVAIPEAEFSLPEINNGLAPMISLMGIRNRCSRKLCMEMAGLGSRLNAREAMAAGIINRIATTDVIQEAQELAQKLAMGNLEALGICKQYYIASSGLAYEQQLEIGRHYLVSMLKGQI